jgi:FkbM family methyltransferase
MQAGSSPRPPEKGVLAAVRLALDDHRKLPFRFAEIWTHGGRESHQRRLLESQAQEVRDALRIRGLRPPADWSSEELRRGLHEVLVDRCYDVDGFRPGPGGLVVDVGCGFGDFALLALAAGAETQVVAFDPDPENVARTRELLRVNGFEDRATVRAAALGDHDGTVQLGRLSKYMVGLGATQGEIDVPLLRLDSLVLPLPIGLLKVDVEGMEAGVFAGADTVLVRQRPRIIVEVHGAVPAERVDHILRRKGYSRLHASPTLWSEPYGFTRNEFWAPTPLSATR